jgi:lipopolysaccharide export system protein LptA
MQHATAYGNPASVRQKREGTNEYIEGYGLRIEYDARAEKAELFTQARMKRNQDEVRGNYISYDVKTEFFQVVGGGKEAAAPGKEKGRVRAIILPKPKEGAATPAPLPLRGAENIANPGSE